MGELVDKIQSCRRKMEINSMDGVGFLTNGDVHKINRPGLSGLQAFSTCLVGDVQKISAEIRTQKNIFVTHPSRKLYFKNS
jgi:hypothetical protein